MEVNLMCRELTDWEKAVEFHGHECPGIAIGTRAVEAAKLKMGIKFAQDEDLVCVTENDACCVDAVQVLLGCSLGKGNLIYRGTGKMAFSFFNRNTGDSLRIVLKSSPKDMDREVYQAYILHADLDELFAFKKPHFDIPLKATCFLTVVCENCGESVPEHKIRLQNGKKLCLDCFQDYNRGW